MILILGTGGLAQAIQKHFPDALLLGRPTYDFSKQADCDRLIDLYPDPKYLINTVGALTKDVWTNLTVNFTAPTYIATRYLSQSQCHIINIGSASAWWPSYPGLAMDRFSYNLAKESLNNFGQHVNRIYVNSNRCLTTIEPGRFASKMSNYETGLEIQDIVNCVKMAMDHRMQQISLIK